MEHLLFALPVLVCPLAMAAMMFFMMRKPKHQQARSQGDPREQELAALRTQIEDLRAAIGVDGHRTGSSNTR